MDNKMQIWTPSLNCLESRQKTAEVFSSDSTTHDFINTDSDDKSGVNTSESHFKAKQVQHVLHNMQQMVSTFGNSKTQF